MPRAYRLGRRQASVDQTWGSIVRAARELVAEHGSGRVSVRLIAERAGVSRLTVYQRFGSRAALFAALAPHSGAEGTDDLREHLERSCAAWAENPALFRNLGLAVGGEPEAARRIAERLAATDALRPGCSLREAEDVIAVLGSFPVFDRLHRDGRRSTDAVRDILMRLATAVLK